MSKFKVGDKVKYCYAEAQKHAMRNWEGCTGTVIEIRSDGKIRVKTDPGAPQTLDFAAEDYLVHVLEIPQFANAMEVLAWLEEDE